MNRSITLFVAVLGSSLLAGCIGPAPPEYVNGTNITGTPFELYDETVGIFPFTTVLEDPNNVFRHGLPGEETKWEIHGTGGNVASFYCWATALAMQPTGEHQYYTSRRLADIWLNDEVEDRDRFTVWFMAMLGFHTVLEAFPDSLTFDPTGTIGYRVAPLAYNAILELGGAPPPDWVVVSTPGGGTTVVQAPSPVGVPTSPAEGGAP